VAPQGWENEFANAAEIGLYLSVIDLEQSARSDKARRSKSPIELKEWTTIGRPDERPSAGESGLAPSTQGVAEVRFSVRTMCAALKSLSASAALAVAALAMTNGTSALAEEGGHRIAVIDVAYIFKNHPAIQAEVKKVEEELKSFDAELTGKREELQRSAAMMKEYKPGSPEYTQAEEQVAEMESKLRLEMARKRKELADSEAKIYYENYQRIAAGVKFLANHYKINLVLRYNSEEMNLEQGESVIRGVMKSIVYHDESLDMTKGVMQYLDQTMSQAAAQTAKQPQAVQPAQAVR
jgi:Skp family chaperone for outer membrane proteins